MTKIQDYSNTRFSGQVKTAFTEFYKQPLTMLQCEARTGIMRANICRYVANWKKLGVIFPVIKGRCPLSKTLATFWSTNPAYRPTAQTKLFK